MGKTRRFDIVRACEEEFKKARRNKKPWFPRGELIPPGKTYRSKRAYDRNRYKMYSLDIGEEYETHQDES